MALHPPQLPRLPTAPSHPLPPPHVHDPQPPAAMVLQVIPLPDNMTAWHSLLQRALPVTLHTVTARACFTPTPTMPPHCYTLCRTLPGILFTVPTLRT